MLALRYEDGSEQVLVLTDLLTGRSYGIEEADLTEPIRDWIKRTTSERSQRVHASDAAGLTSSVD